MTVRLVSLLITAIALTISAPLTRPAARPLAPPATSGPMATGTNQTGSIGTASPKGAYVGSDACRNCHTAIYDAWRSTFHAYSIVEAEDARRAGFPLPQSLEGGRAPSVRSWNDVLYVVGGRKRIAYVDRHGLVQPESYQHRAGRWAGFPSKPMACGPCHYTGFNQPAATRPSPAVGDAWTEVNIGCEACHGPGGRHRETYDKADIVVDTSSRLCGTCHTAVGRVLPKDEAHATHDLVQIWNEDPHVTGVGSHSHNAFCSRCHSPYNGSWLESASARRVFTEDKQNLTCIGCHDPHRSTGSAYHRGTARLAPPEPPRPQAHIGTDGDFSTSDYVETKTTQALCIRCHTGADRIDLDHAGASCTDCHNAFQHNRGRESRVLHDANHARLSCRPCHADADHLLTVVFKDAGFLQPRTIHNLSTLPSALVQKYGFRYPQIRRDLAVSKSLRAALATSRPDPIEASLKTGYSRPASIPRTHRPAVRPRAPAGLVEALGGRDVEPSGQIGVEAEVQSSRRALLDRPDDVRVYVDLAAAYVAANRPRLAAAVLRWGIECDPTAALLELPLDVMSGGAAERRAEDRQARHSRLVDALPALRSSTDDNRIRQWITGYVQLVNGKFPDAAEAFTRAIDEGAYAPSMEFYAALVALGARAANEAIEELERLSAEHTQWAAPQLGLGVAFVEKHQSAKARPYFDRALATGTHGALAHYVAGLALVRERQSAAAVEAFGQAFSEDPHFTEAGLSLARVYRASGWPSLAIETYRQILKDRPGDFDVHFQLGGLYKWLADTLQFQRRNLEESAASFRVVGDRRARLASLAGEISANRDRALDELAQSLTLRPVDAGAVRQIAEIYRSTGRADEARDTFEWLAGRQPDDWTVRYRLGTVLIQMDRIVPAIAALTAARALAPAQGDVYVALGWAYIRAGRLDEAIRAYEEGVIYEPFNPTLYTNLGAAYASRGAYARARELLRRAIELGSFPLPRLHLTYTNLALIALGEGHRDEATAALENGLRLYPEYAPARSLRDRLAAHPGGSLRIVDVPFVFSDLLEIFGEVSTIPSDID